MGRTPDFLYAALDRSQYAVPASRDRMKLIDSNKPNRKFGERGLSSCSVMRIPQARLP
jgi:hypothetical protein